MPIRRSISGARRLMACLVLMLGFTAPVGFAAPSTQGDPLFADHTRIEIELEGPIRAIVRDRRPTAEEHPFTLRWRTRADQSGELPIEVRARGKSRRRRDVCEFPPLRLDVPRSQAEGTLFAGQDKLKLVTHCARLGSRDRAQHEWVWLEYLAYRFLNTLTDASFRVRAADVTYVREDGRRFTHPGFLIEAEDRLAERLGLALSEARTVAAGAMDPAQRTRIELFQYFIGNTDFSLNAAPGGDTCCHNAVQLLDEAGAHHPVPYDFDRSGLLNKPGVLPARGIGIRRVIDRRFVGSCRSPGALDAALDEFRGARARIDALLAQQPELRDRKRRLTAKFLEAFWETIERPERVQREFHDRCRPLPD